MPSPWPGRACETRTELCQPATVQRYREALPPFDTTDGLPIGADLFVIGFPGERSRSRSPRPAPPGRRGHRARPRRLDSDRIHYIKRARANRGWDGAGVESGRAAGTRVWIRWTRGRSYDSCKEVVTRDVAAQVRDAVVDAIDPLEIILFGSLAHAATGRDLISW